MPTARHTLQLELIEMTAYPSPNQLIHLPAAYAAAAGRRSGAAAAPTTGAKVAPTLAAAPAVLEGEKWVGRNACMNRLLPVPANTEPAAIGTPVFIALGKEWVFGAL